MKDVEVGSFRMRHSITCFITSKSNNTTILMNDDPFITRNDSKLTPIYSILIFMKKRIIFTVVIIYD